MTDFTLYFKKANETLTIVWEDLPAESQSYIIAYGLRQSLADSFASAQNETEAGALLFKRHEALLSGTIGQRTGGGGISDLDREILAIMKALIKAKVKGLSAEALTTEAEKRIKTLTEAQLALLTENAEANLTERARAAKAKAAALAKIQNAI